MFTPTAPPHHFILFQLDFDVKFPLLRLFLFLSDLKSTISQLQTTFPLVLAIYVEFQTNISMI